MKYINHIQITVGYNKLYLLTVGAIVCQLKPTIKISFFKFLVIF